MGKRLQALLRPPLWIRIFAPPVVFAALIFLFVEGRTDGAAAYLIYCLSAYCLLLWVLPMPSLLRRLRRAVTQSRPVRRLLGSEFGRRYRAEPAFRGCVSLYWSVIVDLFYAAFRAAVGIRYASVWFLSMAAYYLVLGVLRLLLILRYRRGGAAELRAYRRTARLLFVLNVPMGGMILLMVRAGSGFSYPEYVTYLSAMYTFYISIRSGIRLTAFRRLGSPVLSAAKILDVVAALMSVLGLQTAMIARFSSQGEAFRRQMNAITGTAVWVAVIAIAVFMLLRSKTMQREDASHESL